MQPRRGARGGGKAANPNAWLGSAWGGAMGRFGAGAGGAKPAVIRVGTTFQADVPPWRGPAALDGSEAADVGRNAPPASEAHSPRVLAPLADAERPKKSARVEARSEQIRKNAEHTATHVSSRTPAVTKPRESEPDRAARLGGIRVWPPEGSLAFGRATRASAKRPPFSALAADATAATENIARPAGFTSRASGSQTSPSRVATASEDRQRSSLGGPHSSPRTSRASHASGPANPSVKAAAVARAAAAAARAVAASREPRAATLASVAGRSPKKADASEPDTRLSGKRGTQPATADLAPRTADVHALMTSETPLPAAAASPPLVPAPARSARPSPAEVAIARAHLDARLRASRSSPALMGLSRMGVASLETRGWTAPSAAAFELALREKKFSVFAVSRLGTGRKKPLDPPRRERAVKVGESDVVVTTGTHKEATVSLTAVGHVTNDAAVEPPSEASVEPPSGEAPDPRLAGKSFACMVEYYYNVLLTRPDAEDDDDDRSACDEDEFAAAPELERGGAKRRGARAPAANASTGGVPRSASERELARLGVGERLPKKKKVVRPALTPAEASARVAELLRFTRRASVSAVAACAELSAELSAEKVEKARSIPRHGDEKPRASRGADPSAAAAAAAGEAATPVSVAAGAPRAPAADLKAMAKMTRRWREAWFGSENGNAVGSSDLSGLRKGLSALKGRTRKRAANDVAAGFSTDEDA